MAQLGKKLWQKIESPQGRAYISDVVEIVSDKEAIRYAEISLEYHRECVKVLREFLKEHPAPRKP